jgi:hypothetical protein
MMADTADGVTFTTVAAAIFPVIHMPDCLCVGCVEEWAEGHVAAVYHSFGEERHTVSFKRLVGSCPAYVARFLFPPHVESAILEAVRDCLAGHDDNPPSVDSDWS